MRKPSRRSCKICKTKFTATYDNVWWCCPEHGYEYSQLLLAKKKLAADRKRKKEAQQERRELKVRKAALKPLSHWIGMTQRAYNDWRREYLLSLGHGCISCGTKVAMVWHCGHYRTTAAAPQLRFTEDNTWLQCPSCNVHKSGNIEAYRTNLVALIGESRVQELECNNESHRYTREELDCIRADARSKLRSLNQEVLL
ncbi:recombination protein NinG [Citrobacter werkmanii]|uniref:recombination protein NinG n=1 Tax=Citrobacter werkmanii TaxID=67827 RepID=UPI0018FF1824|nr:recombination protein NinG [Citrobacter werkmanii]MBJ9293578.1 recombination protein NinG [Citrobacter werkmanii]